MLKVVPWLNSSEFKAVYSGLFEGDITSKRSAIARINVWKSRCVLPVALESTAALFDVIVRHLDVTGSGQSTDEALRNAYSLAIIRFVNHITERGQVRVKLRPVHILAKELGVPEWIVNLRHDATHGRLPSLNILKTAADWCIQWLKDEYWDVQLQGKETTKWSYNKTSSSLPNLFKQIRALKVKNNRAIAYLAECLKMVNFHKSKMKKLNQLLQKVETAVLSNRFDAVRQFSKLIIEEVDKNTEQCDILFIYKPVINIYHNAGLTLTLLKQLPVTEDYHSIIVSLVSDLADIDNKSKAEEYLIHILNRPDQYSVLQLITNFDLHRLLPKDKAKQLTALCRLTESSQPTDAESKMIYTTCDLEKCTEKISSANSSWTICSDYSEWQHIPLGCLLDRPVTHGNLLLGEQPGVGRVETSHYQVECEDYCMNVDEHETTQSDSHEVWSEKDVNKIQNLIQLF